MAANKSKGKGNEFEREIAKYLTGWANNGNKKEYWYWRSPSSGAIATICPENGTVSGDIIALKPEGAALTSKFSIEAKKGYPKTSLHGVMKGNKDELIGFWKQAYDGAKASKKSPMLIYKKHLHNALVGVDYGYIHPLMSTEFFGRAKWVQVNFGMGMPVCTFFDMDEFFSEVTYDKLLKFNQTPA